MASLGKSGEVIHCRYLTARHLVQLGMGVVRPLDAGPGRFGQGCVIPCSNLPGPLTCLA